MSELGIIEEIQCGRDYKMIPVFPAGTVDYNKCVVCKSQLLNGNVKVYLYDKENKYVKTGSVPLKICSKCGIGFAIPSVTAKYIQKTCKGLHADMFILPKRENKKYSSADIVDRIEKRNSVKKKNKRRLNDTIKLIVKEKGGGKANDIIIPDGETIYVGFEDKHECSGKMVGSLWSYDKILVSNGKVFSRNIRICVRCKKLFISKEEFYRNEIVPDNYNFIEEDNEIKQISPKDFMIKVNLFKCVYGKHKLKDIKCSVPISPFSGGATRVEIPALYCYVCKQYYILEADFSRLKRMGKILCNIVDREHVRSLEYTHNEYNLNEESLLHMMGYNVSNSNGLSCKQRWHILESAVDFNIMTRAQICSHLDYLIHRSIRRSNYDDAISKWETDRNHIANYDNKDLESIEANTITK